MIFPSGRLKLTVVAIGRFQLMNAERCTKGPAGSGVVCRFRLPSYTSISGIGSLVTSVTFAQRPGTHRQQFEHSLALAALALCASVHPERLMGKLAGKIALVSGASSGIG